jgi:hypothetical protein
LQHVGPSREAAEHVLQPRGAGQAVVVGDGDEWRTRGSEAGVSTSAGSKVRRQSHRTHPERGVTDECRQLLPRLVSRSVVDEHDLEAVPGKGLALERGNEPRQVLRPSIRADDRRDLGDVAAPRRTRRVFDHGGDL